jgi:ornithine--oxo-acid transaminase
MKVVLAEGQGVRVRDVEGKEYIDCLSAYSCVNQGHCHPTIVDALVKQAGRLAITSRAFYSDNLGAYGHTITELLGYDRVLPMNTGAEAVESAAKLAKRWAYKVKGVPEDQAVLLFAKDNFHGRTSLPIAASTDPSSYAGYGPLLPGLATVPYSDAAALEAAFEQNGRNIAAFIVEPIQGEAGVVVPEPGYLRAVRDLCTKYNVLFIADEVQTGLARTGRMLAVDHEDVRPDMVILGKALSGGMFPVSAVLGDDEVMLTIRPGEHGSTFGGNPIANAVAMAALKVIVEENLCQRAAERGEQFRAGLRALNSPIITNVRGKGLLNAMVVAPGVDAMKVCYALKQGGVLAKPTHVDKIRLAPPLVISEEEVNHVVSVIGLALKTFE